MNTKTETLNQLTLAVVLVLLLVIAGTLDRLSNSVGGNELIQPLDEQVLPSSGVTLPISWGDIGVRMVEAGIIDQEKFTKLYESRGGLSPDMQKLAYGDYNDSVVVNRENAGVILNLLWALGLSNENEILDSGPMISERYGGDAGRFASTGGWNLSVGNPMDHYSKHSFVVLTSDQQMRVENVAKGMYRPCCNNSTYFPDCNHGMAMLGLLQLLASEGLSEDEMYRVALAVNSYWFPDTYLTIATHFEQKGISWNDVDSRVILSEEYSSSAGYQRVLAETQPQSRSGSPCSV